eukprot:jgi/Chlat1/7239/Chrsp58S06884
MQQAYTQDPNTYQWSQPSAYTGYTAGAYPTAWQPQQPTTTAVEGAGYQYSAVPADNAQWQYPPVATTYQEQQPPPPGQVDTQATAEAPPGQEPQPVASTSYAYPPATNGSVPQPQYAYPGYGQDGAQAYSGTYYSEYPPSTGAAGSTASNYSTSTYTTADSTQDYSAQWAAYYAQQAAAATQAATPTSVAASLSSQAQAAPWQTQPQAPIQPHYHTQAQQQYWTAPRPQATPAVQPAKPQPLARSQPPLPPPLPHQPKFQIQPNPRFAGVSYASAVRGSSAPAYISVPATAASAIATATAATTPTVKPPVSGQWPKSLRAYVERSFAQATDDVSRAVIESKLKGIITKASVEGALWTRDWDAEALPSRRNRRTQRFVLAGKEKISGGAGTKAWSSAQWQANGQAVEDINWESRSIKGTCQTIEKSYFRLTSAPDPSTVRPPDVLQKAMDMVRNSDRNYFYTKDQMKSIRQDLTVQHIKSKLTTEAYELHARLALQNGDLAEYNQCQTQLNALYEEGLPGTISEFSSYRLLYCVFHQGSSLDLLAALSKLTGKLRQDPAVQHALAVREAVAANNYCAFFRLYSHAPNLNASLMDVYLERARLEACQCITRACRPTIPVEFLVDQLGFKLIEGSEGEEPIEACVEWLQQHGAITISLSEGDALDCKASTGQLFIPVDEDAVAHGDATLAVEDFLARVT